jgi:ACT domain-containing protein
MKITEDIIRKITLETIEELGLGATKDEIKNAVRSKIETMNVDNIDLKNKSLDSGRVILTSFGLNKPGIVASVTKALAENSCDILDLSQKIMGDFFTMIMIIDITASPKDLSEVQREMQKVAEDLKIKIYLQHEDVFRFMHRI